MQHHAVYHLGIDVGDKLSVIGLFYRSHNIGVPIVKPPRTSCKESPLHELWIEDPDGNAIEICARLTDGELAGTPQDQEPVLLVPDTVQS